MNPITITAQRRDKVPTPGAKGYVYTAEAEGISAESRVAPLCNLARKLIETRPDYAERPWQFMRNGAVSLSGPSLAKLAGLTVTEPEKTSAELRIWKPRP